MAEHYNRSYPHPSDYNPFEEDEQATTERSLEDLHDHIVKAFNTVNFLIEEKEQKATVPDPVWAHKLGQAIALSVGHDHVMDKDEVRNVWRDEFLTNVMVPFLDWIIEKYQQMESEFLSDISGRGRPATPEQVYSFQELLRKVNAMKTTIHVLQEWRG